ncbi:MAG: cyclic nucleotide-binding domain-containing protein [Pseudonocardiales bacterium]
MHHNEKRELVARLAGFPFLAGCRQDDVAALVEAGTTRTLPDGWAFVQEGTPADACYVLLSGTVRVYYGRDLVATMTDGDVIGEMAYLGGGQRNATVTSHGKVSVLRIEYEDLTKLLARRPALGIALRRAYDAHAHNTQPTTDGSAPA